jgi:hypothetical protein
MNKEQIKTNNDAKAITAHFDKNEPLWKTNVPVSTCVNNIKAYNSGIDNAAFDQENKTTNGLTANKKQALDLAIAIALSIILKLRPFAKRTNNMELLKDIDIAPTNFKQVKEEITVNLCLKIAQRARQYLPEMATYTLTENEITALETAIEPFGKITEKRDLTQGERVSATAQIEKLTHLILQELDILDDLVKSQITDEGFKTTYFNLR